MKSYSCAVLSDGEKVKRKKMQLANSVKYIASAAGKEDYSRIIAACADAIKEANALADFKADGIS